jgi:hypothetical protein
VCDDVSIVTRADDSAALASCKRHLAPLPMPSDEKYVPITLGEWLPSDVKTFLEAIYTTLWSTKRKLVFVEQKLQGKIDKSMVKKHAPILKSVAETLEALKLK